MSEKEIHLYYTIITAVYRIYYYWKNMNIYIYI